MLKRSRTPSAEVSGVLVGLLTMACAVATEPTIQFDTRTLFDPGSGVVVVLWRGTDRPATNQCTLATGVDMATGKQRWSIESTGHLTGGGRTTSYPKPILVAGRVIVWGAVGKAKGLLGIDVETGALAWSDPDGTQRLKGQHGSNIVLLSVTAKSSKLILLAAADGKPQREIPLAASGRWTPLLLDAARGEAAHWTPVKGGTAIEVYDLAQGSKRSTPVSRGTGDPLFYRDGSVYRLGSGWRTLAAVPALPKAPAWELSLPENVQFGGGQPPGYLIGTGVSSKKPYVVDATSGKLRVEDALAGLSNRPRPLLATLRKNQQLVRLDPKTGVAKRLSDVDVKLDGPRAAWPGEGGRTYCLSGDYRLVCLDETRRDTTWEVDLANRFPVTVWDRAGVVGVLLPDGEVVTLGAKDGAVKSRTKLAHTTPIAPR